MDSELRITEALILEGLGLHEAGTRGTWRYDPDGGYVLCENGIIFDVREGNGRGAENALFTAHAHAYYPDALREADRLRSEIRALQVEWHRAEDQRQAQANLLQRELESVYRERDALDVAFIETKAERDAIGRVVAAMVHAVSVVHAKDPDPSEMPIMGYDEDTYTWYVRRTLESVAHDEETLSEALREAGYTTEAVAVDDALERSKKPGPNVVEE